MKVLLVFVLFAAGKKDKCFLKHGRNLFFSKFLLILKEAQPEDGESLAHLAQDLTVT